MSVIICATGRPDSGKSEFCNQLRLHVQGSIGFESSELITEIANEFNTYLNLKHQSMPDVLSQPEKYYPVVNEVLDQLQTNHPNLLPDSISFMPEEVVAAPEQFESLHSYMQDVAQYPEIILQRITVENKKTYRQLLRWLGGFFVFKAAPTVWFDELARRITRFNPTPELVTVNALRYPSDEKAMREFAASHGHTCVVVEVRRPGTEEGTDVTETSRSEVTPDIIVVNEGSLKDLSKTADDILHDIRKAKLRAEYRTS